MNKNRLIVNDAAVRTVAAAALFATLAFASAQAVAARASAGDRVEVRISELRSQINITPAQESQWNKVTQVMRDNAKTQDSLVKSRTENAKTMTAVEDIKSYGEIVAAHAQGIEKLSPVFEALYAELSVAQKKEADETFRHGHKHGHHADNKN